MIEYLDWDTNFFGIKIGRYETDMLTADVLSNILNLKEKEHYQRIYLFAQKEDEYITDYLSSLNIVPLDRKVTYQREVAESVKETSKIVIYRGPLTMELLQLALESGHQSRFKKDTALASKYDLLYKMWIEKSLTGELADAVLIYEGNGIQGFVTLKKHNDLGKIGLIAVHPSQQGKGIGTMLMNAAMNWYHTSNLKRCEVVTQMENTGACCLYEKAGYTINHIDLVYHL